jgi:potassium/sodium efflux P-type ATPase
MNEEGIPAGREPWRRDVADVAAEIATDINRGLTSAEAASRLERFGPNELEAEAQVPAWKKFLAQFQDPLIYLLFAAIAISVVAWIVEGAHGVPYEAIVILAIVLLNAVLGYVQESRAEQAVATLQKMAAASASVIRDGQEQRIPAATIAPGDLIVLAEGDAVSADARLVHASSLTVAEAPLTGESEAVLKDINPLTEPAGIGDRLNMVFSGTAVTRGRGKAIVTGTGMKTEMGHIARLLETTEVERTPLEREIAGIGKALGIAVIVIAIVVIGAILLTSDIESTSDVVDVLLVGVSLAVAAVPEGLRAVLTVVLALGVQRMAKKNAIVKKLSSVETLGSASVICSDKTGTLTRNEMTIEKVITGSGEASITGTGYRPEGIIVTDGEPVKNQTLLQEVRDVLTGGSLSNGAMLREDIGEWTIQGDPTDAAFLVAQRKLEGLHQEVTQRFKRVGEVPFTSERKMMSTLQADTRNDGDLAIVTKGAPDVLLARCTEERVAGTHRPLTDERRKAILVDVDRLADDALRTLAVAYRPVPIGVQPLEDESIEQELIYLGLVGIIDPPRAEVRDAIVEARSAGIRVVMITGDHPKTAARIADDLNITDATSPALTGTELEAMDEQQFWEKVNLVSVYARVAPEHKLRIVDALKENGHIVSMTGDGVNDAPALKRADIGVAMGSTGTDVSKEASDMILSDDNFGTIVAAVREGRGIFDNIRKFIRFLLSSNVGEVLTMFLGVMLAGVIGLEDAAGGTLAVPLLATQILWINLLTDSAPALAMGVDPTSGDVMRRKPRKLTDRVIDGEMWLSIFVIGTVMAVVTLAALDWKLTGGLFGGDGTIEEARTMAFTTLVFAQLFNTFNCRSDEVSAFDHMFTNKWLWGAIGLSAVLQVAVVHLPFLNTAFGTRPLSLTDWLVCIGLASVVLWADEVKKVIERWIHGRHA